MPQDPLPSFAAVLRNLREQARCTQAELERRAGLARGRVSQLELGDRTLDRGELVRLVGILGYAWPNEVIDRAAAGVALLPSLAEPADASGANPYERRIVEASAALIVRAFDGLYCEKVTEALVAERWRQEREEAAQLWNLYRKESETKRKILVQAVEGFHTWAMCERFCAASVGAAAHDAGEARKLADLALEAASKAKWVEAWCDYLQGYAYAFVGNSWRVAGNLREADRAFETSDALSGETPPTGCPLDPTRRLSLKATLRKNQRRYAEALPLLAEALSSTSNSVQIARLRIHRASIHEKAGSFAEALADLAFAEPLLKGVEDLRLRLQMEFSRALNLWHLERFAEAREILEQRIKPLSLELGRDLDRLRVRWLEARIAEGLGKPGDAVAGFQEVWQKFADRGIAFDAALAVLELAALELELGRTREVKALASTAAPIFAAQAIPRELLASLHLFWTAARREKATATAARHLLEELQRLGPARGES